MGEDLRPERNHPPACDLGVDPHLDNLGFRRSIPQNRGFLALNYELEFEWCRLEMFWADRFLLRADQMSANRREAPRTSVFMPGQGWFQENPAVLDLRVFDVSLGGLRCRLMGRPTSGVFYALLNDVTDVLVCDVVRQSQIAREVYEIGLRVRAIIPVGEAPWSMEVAFAEASESVEPEELSEPTEKTSAGMLTKLKRMLALGLAS